MVTINGYTAEKMQEIADNTIVGAALSGDDLIFTKQDTTTINVGSVRGFPGISDMSLYDPVGVVKFLMISAVPTGYGVLNASVEYEGVDYPILAAEYLTGAACVNGPCAPGKFRLPDMRGMSPFGLHPGITAFDTLLKTGGSKDSVVVAHDHTAGQAGHVHSVDVPNHAHVISGDGTHSHSIADYNATDDVIQINYASTHATSFVSTTGDAQQTTASHLNDAGGHSHGGATQGHDEPAFNSGSADAGITVNSNGVSGTDKNLPPYRVGNWIMRLG